MREEIFRSLVSKSSHNKRILALFKKCIKELPVRVIHFNFKKVIKRLAFNVEWGGGEEKVDREEQMNIDEVVCIFCKTLSHRLNFILFYLLQSESDIMVDINRK